jgi:hypothetical protein
MAARCCHRRRALKVRDERYRSLHLGDRGRSPRRRVAAAIPGPIDLHALLAKPIELMSILATPPDPRSPKEVWDEQHRLLANDPLAWQLKAESLIAAFEVLIADDERRAAENAQGRQIQSVAYMLAGFAIENLLKGQLIARRQHLDAAGKFKLGHHALRQLASDAGYSMDKAESRLLERIQQFTVWTAKYPVPLDSEAMRPRPTPDGGFAPRTYHQVGEDWPAVRAFFARFDNDLRHHRSQRDAVS